MAQSKAIYGYEYGKLIAEGSLQPSDYDWTFLAEGDSWMDRSSALTYSLPAFLADAMTAAGHSVLIVNLSRFGHTMRRIGECVEGEFGMWVGGTTFDAILLSAGGNDFIDAARDPAPGLGLLRNLAGQPLPAHGYDCVDKDALAALVVDYLDPNFAKLIALVRAGPNAATPVFLNNYDTPVARNAPAPPGKKAWLYEAYTKNGIAPALWPDLTDGIFNDLQTTIAGWATQHDGVHVVPTDGTLTPAEPGSPKDSGDWINEIHPNKGGWKKLAPVWRDAILGVI